MRKIFALLFLLLPLACGPDHKPMEPKTAKQELIEKHVDYLKWSTVLLEPLSGWVTKEWDSTLFTGLRGCYAYVDLTKAQLSPGEWTRRNLSWGGDWRDHSASRVSRDMLLGVAWWAHCTKRKDVAADVVAYAKAHGGVMGPGDPFRTDIRQPLLDTFKLIAGEIDKAPPVPATGLETGYERHLAALHILLRAELTGGVTGLQKIWIRAQAKEQPKNPLYELLNARFVTGDYDKITRMLLDEAFWPRRSLPTSANYCETWVMQRDDGKDWKPCERGKYRTWSASDWLFVVRYVTG